LPDFSLTGPGGMTSVGWLIALGLATLTWWVIYRAFHAMTVADDRSLGETEGSSRAADPGDPELHGEPILHPQLVADHEDSTGADWDRFERLEKELAEISSADSLEMGVTRCAGLLRERWGASCAAVWSTRGGESLSPGEPGGELGEASTSVSHHTGLLRSDHEDDEGGTAETRSHRHDGRWDPALTFGPWMDALAAGELVCIPDVSAEPLFSDKIADGIGSLAIFPLFAAGHRGGMAVGWPEPLVIGPSQARWTKRAGRSIEATIERILRRESLAALSAQVRVLLDVGGILAREKDLAGALQALVQALRDRLGYPVCAILLVDEEKKDLHVASMTGYGDDVYALRLPLDGSSITATAARERRTIDVPEVSAWNGFVAGAPDMRSEIACPLVYEGRLLGVLDVESGRADAFDERDRRTLEAVAWQAALALGHFRLLSQLGERAQRLELVDGMARAISSTLDAKSLFQIVVDQVRAAAGAERATLVQIGDESEEARVAAVSSVRPVAGLEAGDAVSLEGFPREQLAGPRALYVPDLEAEDDSVHSRLRGSGFRSLVRVPIYIDGKLAGLFTASCERAGAFSPAQIEILEAVAPHVSAALRNARLFEQVERSFQELSNAQGHLVQAEQLRVLGEMASGVAHNFNNVLGAILGRAQMVRARTGDPLIARELGVIEQAAMDGAATVRRLQEFTRLRTDHEFVPVDVSQVARDALALTRTWWKDRAEERGVSYGILTDFAEGVWVEGQDHELREVAVNILLNAIEAMANGGSLYLASRVSEGQAVLEVTDSGVGMSDEVQKRLFHPFYSTKGPGGTGLGLSIAYGIMQRHHGKIDVTSRRGAGTTVRITLPASTRGPDAAMPTPAIEPAAVDASILLVEDEPAVLSLLTDLLEGATYKVVIARTGREAVEKLIEGSFDVVITDLGMPEMSGWELARHCRDLYPELPVILCTGWGVELDEGLVEETGVRAVIAKPFSVIEVLGTVARILEESPPAERAA
jgi:signal transduction histidine kinase/ActR/RegA family two-component response regulator